MALTNEEILNAVAEKTVLELVELISAFEEKFNVSAAAVAVAAGPAAGGDAAPAVVEQTEFDVILQSGGANKLNVVKEVKNLLGLGLKEAKDLVEAAPKPIKENVDKKTADELKAKLAAAGATVDIK